MKTSSKIIVVVAIISVVIVTLSAYAFLNSALAPLDRKEDKTQIAATQNVEIQATTFNGDIIIQRSTSKDIAITFGIQAPQGHLIDIADSATNQTQNGITKVFAKAEMVNPKIELRANYGVTITIELPTASQYNLTLSTLNGNIIKPQLNDTAVVATTSNGRIDIEDDNANSIEASSANGDINVSLVKGTLFQVDAVSANGHVTYQDIAMRTNVQTTTHLNGETSDGSGNLVLKLSSANGDVTIQYITE